MPGQGELDAAFKAVRSLIDGRAGWYASLISDAMIRDVVREALVAAEAARSGPAPAHESVIA